MYTLCGIGLIAVAFVVTGCRPNPEVQAPIPAADLVVVATAPAHSTPPEPGPVDLKRAAVYVLSVDCGACMLDPEYHKNDQMLKAAGPAIVPVLTELVPYKWLSAWFVGNAAIRAASFPFSDEFRQALRDRRDDPDFLLDQGPWLSVFQYFVAYGDKSDLAWMERAVESMDKTRRPIGEKEIQKLRTRLTSG